MRRRLFLAIAAAALAAGPAAAQTKAGPGDSRGVKVDVELVLAVDVSGSVDPEEAALQRDGYIKALRHKEVMRAIQSGQHRRIALTYVEWAGYHYQRTVVDWMVIRNPEDVEQMVAVLNESPPTIERWTSISGAMEYALKKFAESKFDGVRRVLDISGDGRNNNGRDVLDARAEVLSKGITINGLPIVNDRPTRWGHPPERDLDKYYAENVIGGPGAFLIVAEGFDSFAHAVRSKLLKEIAGRERPAERAERE
jgi:hypothetical protein